MLVLPVIRVQVTFLSRKNGGRAVMPSLSFGGYLPHLVIQPPDVRGPKVIDGNVIVDDYLGVRFLPTPKNPAADHPIDCDLELMYHPSVNYDAVREGATFTVREGGKVVGFGVVVSRAD